MSEKGCPILWLPELATEHWDADSPCSLFECGECVATLGDLGYPGKDLLRLEEEEGEEPRADWEIPF